MNSGHCMNDQNLNLEKIGVIVKLYIFHITYLVIFNLRHVNKTLNLKSYLFFLGMGASSLV